MDTKVCRNCGLVKPLGSFRRSPASGDGRGATCRECVCAREKGPGSLQATLRSALDAGDDATALRLAPRFLAEKKGKPRFGHEGWLLFQAATKGRKRIVEWALESAPTQGVEDAIQETRDPSIRDLLLAYRMGGPIRRTGKAEEHQFLLSSIIRESRKGNPMELPTAQRLEMEREPLFLSALGHDRRLEALMRENPAVLEIRWENGDSLLHVCAASALGREEPATERGLVAVASLLLKHGADLEDQGNREGKTPLFLACEFGNRAVAEFLMGSGARVNVSKNNDNIGGSTPLDGALQHQFYDIAEFLVKRGADPNVLWPYAYKGKREQVKWLLERGADPNRRDGAGNTPLHLAARRNNLAHVAKVLVEGGADPLLHNREGISAVEMARQEEKKAVFEFLHTLLESRGRQR